MKKKTQDLLTIYKNYLYALRVREEYGAKYGDTQYLIDTYESILTKNGIKTLKKEKKTKGEK